MIDAEAVAKAWETIAKARMEAKGYSQEYTDEFLSSLGMYFDPENQDHWAEMLDAILQQ